MIYNYLDWVKMKRKAALREAKHDCERSKKYRSPWLVGYLLGWSAASLHSSRDWRALQKDMEARQKGDHLKPWNDLETARKLREI